MTAMIRHQSDIEPITAKSVTPDRTKFRPTIRGVTYRSAEAASEALGVAPTTIHQARRRGALDGVGLGKGSHPGPRGHTRGKPFTIGSHTWPSMRACSLDLGHYDGYVGSVMSRGSEVQKRTLIRRYMEWAGKKGGVQSVAGEAGQ